MTLERLYSKVVIKVVFGGMFGEEKRSMQSFACISSGSKPGTSFS